jgi:hypothetical protein
VRRTGVDAIFFALHLINETSTGISGFQKNQLYGVDVVIIAFQEKQ